MPARGGKAFVTRTQLRPPLRVDHMQVDSVEDLKLEWEELVLRLRS